MPPDTPASTNRKPCSDASAARRCESRKLELPSVDDHVPRVAEAEQRPERLLGRRPGRDHHPDDPRRLELRDELFQRVRGAASAAGVGRDLVPVLP